MQAGARGCPERCGHRVGRDQGTGRGFGVQRGDPGCVAGVQSGRGPELGSGECPGAGLWPTKSECGRWARSGQEPPENCLRVSCSPSPHPVQGQWDHQGQWGRRAPHHWADVLRAEEGRTPSTWVSSGCCRRRMSTLGAERVWSTERLYAWQTAVCPLPGAKGPGQLSISASHGVPEGVRTERKYWGEGCGEEVRAGRNVLGNLINHTQHCY